MFTYDSINVVGARVHNLKNIDVTIPKNKLVVVTGLSGSGKSSLVFNTIYSESKRRYIESFSAYARRFMGNIERPDVDRISGLGPVIAIKQRNTNNNPRSTVGTVTEIYHFLRLLFSSIGEAYSVNGIKMSGQSVNQIVDNILSKYTGSSISILAPLVKGRKGEYKELIYKLKKIGFNKVRVDGDFYDLHSELKIDRYKIHDIDILVDRVVVDNRNVERLSDSVNTAIKYGNGIALLNVNGRDSYVSTSIVDPETGISYDAPSPNMFSFNSSYGACKICDGLGEILNIKKEVAIPNDAISIGAGGIVPIGPYKNNAFFYNISNILKYYGVSLDTPINQLSKFVIDSIFNGIPSDVSASIGLDETFGGLCKYFATKKGKEIFIDRVECTSCGGSRLDAKALNFKINNKNIYDVCKENVEEIDQWINNVHNILTERQLRLVDTLIKEIKKRISFIIKMGLGYISLTRPFSTLSGGEAQRMRLATQLSSQLIGITYILDEPSIGLHQKDNSVLINLLKYLRDIGNSILVIEHDKDIMLESDYIIDIGPAAGVNGGRVVGSGVTKDFIKQNSITAGYLNGNFNIDIPSKLREGAGKQLTIKGCSGNNLKNVNLSIPLGKFICVTGVSGSGKSSLINKTLYPAVYNYINSTTLPTLPYKSIDGVDNIKKVYIVDQLPIGKSSRSNAITYLDLFSDIRNIYASLPDAKIRGYNSGYFSFNMKAGQCKACEGLGVKIIDMDLLSSVNVSCDVCDGKRYSNEILNIKYRGMSIADVLAMTVDYAIDFFEKTFAICNKLKALRQVGLGYITLGQSSSTFSGGEAQRIKLANELSKRSYGETLYILDEPTTGLHFQDIKNFLEIINKLVDAGNTVIIIEHNLDVIKVADYVIDIGPDSGSDGGKIIAQGAPSNLSDNRKSYTANFLKLLLK